MSTETQAVETAGIVAETNENLTSADLRERVAQAFAALKRSPKFSKSVSNLVHQLTPNSCEEQATADSEALRDWYTNCYEAAQGIMEVPANITIHVGAYDYNPQRALEAVFRGMESERGKNLREGLKDRISAIGKRSS